jgi:hypothetical protein
MVYKVGSTFLVQTVKYYFVCPELHGMFQRIKAAADRLGLLDPAAAWDVVPFSFVLDWFVDIGTWLHKNLKPNWYPVDCVISDWAESLFRETTYQGGLTFTGLASSDGLNQHALQSYTNIPFVSGSIYQSVRKRQFPAKLVVDRSTWEASFRRTFLRANRTIIGCCLVGQRCKPVYRHYLAGRYIKRARIS